MQPAPRKSKPQQPRRVGVHFDGDLRAELIGHAVNAIESTGVDSFSLRDVARRAGVTHAAPAHHFGDRRGLLTAIATEGFQKFIEDLAPAAFLEGTPAEIWIAMANAYMVFSVERRGFFDVMFDVTVLNSDDPAYVSAADAAFVALRGVVERCQDMGWRSDEDEIVLAAAAWSAAHGLAVLRRTGALNRHHRAAEMSDVAPIVRALLDPHWR